MNIEQKFTEMQERHKKEFSDLLKNDESKTPFRPESNDLKTYHSMSGELSTDSMAYSSTEMINERFAYSRTEKIAIRKERINAATNELIEWQEIYGKGRFVILAHNYDLMVCEYNSDRKRPFGFIKRESAQSVLGKLTDNAKAFIRGEL